MASLRTRTRADGTVSFTVLFRDGPRQSSATFDQAAGAKAFMRDIDRHGVDTALRALDARRDVDADHRTVAQQVQAHIDALPGITLGTRRRYEMIARTIAEHRLGDLPLQVVHTNDVAAWIRDLVAAGLAERTITMRRSLLSTAMRVAVKHGHLTRNPCEDVSIPRGEHREQTYLTGDELDRILAHLDPRHHPLIWTLVMTGLRIGEATALQVRDIHLSDNPPTLTVSRAWKVTGGPERITGPPKTKHGRRTVSLPPEAVEALRPLVSGRRANEWVFTEPSGEPAQMWRVTQDWRRAVVAADVGKYPRLHDLRHTHASWLLAIGVPPTVVQHRLGHSSIQITSDVYGHLLPESQVQAARAASLALGSLGSRSALPQIETIRQT